MSAFSDAIVNFLIGVLLPWVITLIKAYLDRNFKPAVSDDGWVKITGMFQTIYDEAVARPWPKVQACVTGFFCPILGIEVVQAAPAPDVVTPVEARKLVLNDLKDTAQILKDQGEEFPGVVAGFEEIWRPDIEGSGGG
jgi:hypothetical protein